MAAKLSVPVIYDQNGQFFGEGGQLMAVSTDALVTGIVQKPGGLAVPPNVAPLVDTLEIKDKNLGTLYVLMTVEQYQAAADEAVGNSRVKELTWTAKEDTTFVVPAGNTLLGIAIHVNDNTTEDITAGVLTTTDVMLRTTFKKDIWTGKVPLLNFFSPDKDTTVNIAGPRGYVTYKVSLAQP